MAAVELGQSVRWEYGWQAREKLRMSSDGVEVLSRLGMKWCWKRQAERKMEEIVEARIVGVLKEDTWMEETERYLELEKLSWLGVALCGK